MTNHDANRKKNLGIPGNGGQWGARNRSEGLASLLGESQPEQLEFDVTIEYWEKNVLPTPRHRNPRDIKRTVNAPLTFRSVTSEQAPVGVRYVERYGEDSVERRVYDGKLYAPVGRTCESAEDVMQLLGKDTYDDGIGVPWSVGNEASAINHSQEVADGILFIDGEPHMPAPEPVYEVNTYGMGNNQGSTGLSISSVIPDGFATRESIFPADKFEEARAYAIKVAEGRGDTNSARYLAAQEPEIFIDEDVFTPGLTFVEAPRLEFTDLYEVKYGAADLETEFRKLKKQIAAVPGAFDADGRLNASRLTERQADVYKNYLMEIAERQVVWPTRKS